MELPLGGPALRHYTQSRPRPHRQKLNYRPSRPQETIFESENEVLEHMGRVDEGVEEFFTKKVLPLDILKKQEEGEVITVQEVAPASSNPCPAPTKTLRRKLGDFFTLKKRRGSKTETTHDGRPKKASIADLIRPLREVARAEKEKDKDRVKEHDKENEKEKGESAVQEAPVSGAPPLRGETAPPRRALREGKSQSLILLSGSAAGTPNSRNATKKQMEGQHSFEQKLHLMLQRIGVAKPQPAETQNQEREMKKAESEGTIIDNKPEAPPSLSKPRTMSASSDMRHQIRPSVSEHESAGKPPLLPKPVIKPAPTNTTSGLNAPENEQAPTQEGEKNAHTKHSPCSTSSPPVAVDSQTSASTTSTARTISNSVSDSSSATVSPSSTAAHTEVEICTDSAKPIELASLPTTLTEPDGKFTEDSVTTSEPPAGTVLTPSTSTTTPGEPPGADFISSVSSESTTQSSSDTSTVTSTTTVSPSITILEPVGEVSSEIEVSKLSPIMSTQAALPEVNGNLSLSAAAAGDAAVSSVNTTSPSSTSLVAETTVVSSTECVTSISSVSKPSTPSISSDLTETAVLLETPVSASCLSVSSNVSSIAAAASTKSPTSSESVMTTIASTITHPDTLTPCVPSTCNAVTEPDDNTFTTTISSNSADTASTTISSAAAAVSSILSINSDPAHTDSDPGHANNLSNNALTRGISDGPADYPTSPAHLKDSPDQNITLQTSEDDTFSSEPVEKGKADDKFEMVENHEKTEEDKEEGTADFQRTNDAPIVSSEETEGIGQEESDGAKETTVATPSGKEGECGANTDLADGPK